MITGKAKEDFKVWFEKNYNDNFEYYHTDKMTRVLMTIVIDWFYSIGAKEIGGHSISDMIYTSLQTNVPIFMAMKHSILKANEYYNNSNEDEVKKCDHEFIPTNSKWQSQGQRKCIDCGLVID